MDGRTVESPAVTCGEDDARVCRITVSAVRRDSIWKNATSKAEPTMVVVLHAVAFRHV